jgi:DNA polymerase III delta prime subunit
MSLIARYQAKEKKLQAALQQVQAKRKLIAYLDKLDYTERLMERVISEAEDNAKKAIAFIEQDPELSQTQKSTVSRLAQKVYSTTQTYHGIHGLTQSKRKKRKALPKSKK